MNSFSIIAAANSQYFVRGYTGGRTSCCIESRATGDYQQASLWAEAANKGDRPEDASFASYADD